MNDTPRFSPVEMSDKEDVAWKKCLWCNRRIGASLAFIYQIECNYCKNTPKHEWHKLPD